MTFRRGRTAVAVALLVMGLTSGCGDDEAGAGDDPTTTAPAEEGASATADDDDARDEDGSDDSDAAEAPDEGEGDRASPTGSAAGVDACALVTQDQVAAFVGAPVGTGEIENPGACRWAISEPGGWARLVVIDAARYQELLDLGYTQTADGVAVDEENRSVLGVAVMGGDLGVQVGNTIPFFTGSASPGVDAHLAFARAALGSL